MIEKDTDARRTTDEALDERTLAVLASHTAIGTYGVVVLAALLGIALLVAAAIP